MKIVSLNISTIKGVVKQPVSSVEINTDGVKDDAHSGDWHRQVSVLGKECIDKFSVLLKRKIKAGEFAENITLQGFDVSKVKVNDKLVCGNIELKITQIGKNCHNSNCAIFKTAGDCIMPREGIFCSVIKGGILNQGDSFELIKCNYFKS
ncbi:MAG: MOSC domain-containing protein [Bacteroidetes bacterium]|nr:MOSC domain-containing protein [Bacteroidota bacterium]